MEPFPYTKRRGTATLYLLIWTTMGMEKSTLKTSGQFGDHYQISKSGCLDLLCRISTTRAPVGVDKDENFQFWLPGLPHARVEAGKHPGGRLPSKREKARMRKMQIFLQLGLLPMHPGPGGERGGGQEEQLQPRQRDMEVSSSHFINFCSYLLIYGGLPTFSSYFCSQLSR